MLRKSGIESLTSYLYGKWSSIELAPFKELCDQVRKLEDMANIQER